VADTILTFDQDLQLLPEIGLIHMHGGIAGADWRRDRVVALLEQSAAAGHAFVLSDPQRFSIATATGHRLAVRDAGNQWWHVETRNPDDPPRGMCGYEITPMLARLGALRLEYKSVGINGDGRCSARVPGARRDRPGRFRPSGGTWSRQVAAAARVAGSRSGCPARDDQKGACSCGWSATRTALLRRDEATS
jgi:hypothetical protein